MTTHRDVTGILGVITSSLGTIVGWQDQLEFWLRIVSLVIGIVAGAFTIRHYIKKK